MGALMVDSALPVWFRDGNSERQLKQKQPSPPNGITVIFERETEHEGQNILTSAVLSSSTSIQQIRMSGPHQGWFKSGDRLVLGGRELLEHELLGQLPRETGAGYLHVYAKLSNLTTLQLSNAAGESIAYGKALSPVKSALTTSLAESTLKQKDVSEKSIVLQQQTPLEAAGMQQGDFQRDSGTLLHLVIRRPKVELHTTNSSFELTISSTEDIATIKKKVEAHHGLPADSHTLLWKGRQLSASKSLASCGVGSGSILELVPIEPSEAARGTLPGSPLLSSPEHGLYEGWLRARAGLAAGQSPKLASSGTGGSYFIADSDGNNVAVFKPEDEEPLARNNPKGRSGASTEGLRRGVQPGEGAVREVAAFLLDHGHFAGVPPTALVSCQESAELSPSIVKEAKVGSLQAFVDADGDCEERGTGMFGVQQVHKIAVLDIRLANCDRNGGNILLKQVSGQNTCHWELVPIDHGYCLPSSFSDISFEWMYWPQADKPFSKETKEYIAALDVAKDGDVLSAHGLLLRPECQRIRKVCTMLLKKATAKDFTPFAIASVMCRQSRQKSPLEKLHSHAHGLSLGPCGRVDEAKYFTCMSEALDEYLDQLLLEQLE